MTGFWVLTPTPMGFMEALGKEGHFDPERKPVVALEAGGVARAATFAPL